MKPGFLLTPRRAQASPETPTTTTKQNLPNPQVAGKTQKVTRPSFKSKEMEDIQPRNTPRARRFSLCLPTQTLPTKEQTLKALGNTMWDCKDIIPSRDGVGNLTIFELKRNFLPPENCSFWDTLKHLRTIILIKDAEAPAVNPLPFDLPPYAKDLTTEQIAEKLIEKLTYIETINNIGVKIRENDPEKTEALTKKYFNFIEENKRSTRSDTSQHTQIKIQARSLNQARSLGFNAIIKKNSCILHVPDRDTLIHRYNALKNAYEKTDPTRFQNLPKFDIFLADGTLSDQDFILAWVTHTVVLAKFVENLHDSIFHVAPMYGQIIETVNEGLSYDLERFKLVKKLLPYIKRIWQIEMALKTDLKKIDEISRKKIQNGLDQFRSQLALTIDFMAGEYSLEKCHGHIKEFEGTFIARKYILSEDRKGLAEKKYKDKTLNEDQLLGAWGFLNVIGNLITQHKKKFGSFDPNHREFLQVLEVLKDSNDYMLPPLYFLKWGILTTSPI